MKNYQRGSARIIWIIIIAVLVIGVGGIIYSKFFYYSSTANFNPRWITASSTDYYRPMTNLKIALLVAAQPGDDPKIVRGCDVVLMRDRIVPQTQKTPLNATMEELFAKKEPWPYVDNLLGNFLTSQKDLFFEYATIENGVANIYLSGKYTLGGECDDPRTETQIVETAKQFSTVKSVKIFLNGKEFQTPNEKGF